jgi:serine/threonine-protein kinase
VSETKTCPQCGRTYSGDDRFCTVDGAALLSAGGSSLVGTVIADRFLVMEKLGEGGMGEVYLAEHVRIKRKVALKLMRPWMLGDPVAVGRFHREAENASQISHPNVAQVYDFGETAERVVYLAMEFVDGEPLSNILDREGSLLTVRTAEIVRQIGEALTAAHAMGILHRDLKPDNVMVGRTRHGTDLVKLVDFGIARAMHRSTQQFTSTGLVVGTPDYMSPEQLSGDELDGRSDHYALALIAFRLLTGGAAYPGGTSGESMIARLTNPPQRLAMARPDVAWPESLQAAFDRALSPDPNARFADAMEFVAELDAAVSEMPLGEAEQAYLVALSQRHATPVRGGMVMDAVTPARGSGSIRTITPAPTSALEVAVSSPVTTSPVTTPSVELPAFTRMSAEVDASSVRQTGQFESEPLVTEEAPPVAPASTTSGARRRPYLVPVVVAAIGVLALTVFLVTRVRDQAGSPLAAAPPVADSSAGAAVSPLDTASPIDTAVAAAEASDTAWIRAARRATLAVAAPDGGTGAAVLVDSSGLALTAASLVRPDSTVQVYLNGNTLLQTRALSVDRTTGLAAFQVQMRRCTGCGALSPVVSDSFLSDSVFFLPGRNRGEGAPVRVAISGFDGRSIETSSTPSNSMGAPVVSLRTGQLVALGGGRRLVTPTALRDAVASFKGRPRTGAGAADSILPVWPERPVPSSLLGDDAMARVRATTASYRQDQNGLALVVMTPQVIQYRAAMVDNPMIISRDPIKLWSRWSRYAADKRAVVILNASHERAAFPSWPQEDVNFRGTSVKSIRLFRDDSLVAPIETATFPALATNGRQQIGAAGVAVYSALEFRSGTTFRVEVVDTRSQSPVVIALKPGTLEVVRGDVGSLR